MRKSTVSRFIMAVEKLDKAKSEIIYSKFVEPPTQDSKPVTFEPVIYKPYQSSKVKPKKKVFTPKFRLACSCEHSNYVEGNLNQGFNAVNILKRFKESLLEREIQSAKYQQQQNERRAKANKKKEEDAEKDK